MPADKDLGEDRAFGIGRLIGSGLALGLFALAYFVLPDGLADRPLAQLTLADIGEAIFAGCCILWGVRWLLSIWE